MNPIYAHTLADRAPEDWEPLFGADGHAEKVAQRLESYVAGFAGTALEAFAPAFRVLGMLHDIGKASPAFQRYLALSAAKKKAESVDHKSAAAAWVLRLMPGDIRAVLMAYAFLGHHSGLGCGSEFMTTRGAAGGKLLNPEWEELLSRAELLPLLQENAARLKKCRPHFKSAGKADLLFSLQLSVRMLHSALVDADWQATEDFCQPKDSALRDSLHFPSLEQLAERLERHLASFGAPTTPINQWRSRISNACLTSADRKPGVYRLNVPTGGGKTWASLRFALAHARRNGQQRIIYTIPYSSIIDQTARNFRDALGAEAVVEHQSRVSDNNDSERNRFGTENWDAPLIVTTNVQFFDSFFSVSNKRCRKLHRVANSVIVLDEAQSLPTAQLKPCLALLKSLARDFGCTILLCTATQPAFVNFPASAKSENKAFDIGWNTQDVQSLLGEELEQQLAAAFKRVRLSFIGRQTRTELLGHLRDHMATANAASALIIVNLTRQAQALYREARDEGFEGRFHLSARMCPAHREQVLQAVRTRLQEGKPTLLISTRVIEAGVDISFPIVYRERCGLDSLAQSAGRCNRHGELEMGQVFAYEAGDEDGSALLVDVRDGALALDDLRASGLCPDDDLFSPEAVTDYFERFYGKRGGQGWDSRGLVETEIGTRPGAVFNWNFRAMAEDFRLIDNDQQVILVPYGEEAEAIRRELLKLGSRDIMPPRELYRRLQSISVSVYRTEMEHLEAHLEKLHHAAEISMLCTEGLYSIETGLARATGSLPPSSAIS